MIRKNKKYFYLNIKKFNFINIFINNNLNVLLLINYLDNKKEFINLFKCLRKELKILINLNILIDKKIIKISNLLIFNK